MAFGDAAVGGADCHDLPPVVDGRLRRRTVPLANDTSQLSMRSGPTSSQR